jgi:tripartite-type tricarboxylate transporter receptor subunit TctC
MTVAFGTWSPRLSRRGLVLGTAALAASAGPAAAQGGGAAWPVHQVRFVVPFAPGGGQDVFWRIIAERLSRRLRATFIVENKGGAGGGLGAQEVARAAPDGATFLATSNSISILPALYAQLGFDPARDLAPVTLLCDVPGAIMVRSASPLRNLEDLIAKAKAEPGRLTYGSGGVGSSNHLAGALFASMAGIELVHIPYRGVSQAVTAVYAGEIDFTFSSTLELLPHVRQGQARLLGVTMPERVPEIPDVPTIGEVVAGYAAPNWFGMFAPKGMPPALLAPLVAELGLLREDADLKARLASGAAAARLDGPAPLAARLADDMAKWRTVIARANIRAE